MDGKSVQREHPLPHYLSFVIEPPAEICDIFHSCDVVRVMPNYTKATYIFNREVIECHEIMHCIYTYEALRE